MEVVPVSVGRASRAWDEQHLDVAAAARQIGATPTDGFTDAVAPVAARFARRWRGHAGELAGRSEAQADALRRALARYLAAEHSAATTFELLARDPGLVLLRGYLEEVR